MKGFILCVVTMLFVLMLGVVFALMGFVSRRADNPPSKVETKLAGHAMDATIRRVESIRADLCFLGMCSLHPEVGITVGDREEAYVKQAMIRASTEVVGLISLGKMGTSLP